MIKFYQNYMPKNLVFTLCLLITASYSLNRDSLTNQAVNAAMIGNMIELKELLGQGINPNTKEDLSGKTLLELVIEQPNNTIVENSMQLVEMLLFNEPQAANPNLKDNAGNTPLIHAIKLCIAKRLTPYDADAIIQMLINSKARTDIKNKKGQDVFYWINVLKTGYCSDQEFIASLKNKNIYKDIDLATQINLIIQHSHI